MPTNLCGCCGGPPLTPTCCLHYWTCGPHVSCCYDTTNSFIGGTITITVKQYVSGSVAHTYILTATVALPATPPTLDFECCYWTGSIAGGKVTGVSYTVDGTPTAPPTFSIEFHHPYNRIGAAFGNWFVSWLFGVANLSGNVIYTGQDCNNISGTESDGTPPTDGWRHSIDVSVQMKNNFCCCEDSDAGHIGNTEGECVAIDSANTDPDSICRTCCNDGDGCCFDTRDMTMSFDWSTTVTIYGTMDWNTLSQAQWNNMTQCQWNTLVNTGSTSTVSHSIVISISWVDVLGGFYTIGSGCGRWWNQTIVSVASAEALRYCGYVASIEIDGVECGYGIPGSTNTAQLTASWLTDSNSAHAGAWDCQTPGGWSLADVSGGNAWWNTLSLPDIDFGAITGDCTGFSATKTLTAQSGVDFGVLTLYCSTYDRTDTANLSLSVNNCTFEDPNCTYAMGSSPTLGAGSALKKVTKWFGVKPCASCIKRAALLDNLIPDIRHPFRRK